GGKVYSEALDRWDRLYLTLVEGRFKGSAYFPLQELLRQPWRPAAKPEQCPPDEKNPHPHSFHILERVRQADSAQDSSGLGQAMEGLDLPALLTRGTVGS